MNGRGGLRLIAEDLGGDRGGETVFRDISFVLSSGAALTVTGPNGAGKSTLLRIVCGLLPSSAGKVGLSGGGEAWPDIAAACHYLGHRDAMKAALSVVENLVFWQRFLGTPHLAPRKALEMVELGAVGHLPFACLSAGQRRRAAIARLLVSQRPLWLLDEPTVGLDAASQTGFAGLMEAHLSEGGLILAATHLPLGLRQAGELRMGESGR